MCLGDRHTFSETFGATFGDASGEKGYSPACLLPYTTVVRTTSPWAVKTTSDTIGVGF